MTIPSIPGGGGFVDLHTHSTASDGTLPPEEVVKRAKRANLSAIALTDHDTIDGVAAAQAEGARLGVRVVAGTELSAHDDDDRGGQEVHILALHITNTQAIADRLNDFRNARLTRAEKMIEQLQKAGVKIDMQQVLKHAGTGVIGRPHIARALIDVGAAADQKEAFDKYIAAGRPGYVAKPKLTIREAVDIAHKGGAIAFWAHPGHDGTRERIKAAKEAGMDGIEVRHPSHTRDDIDRLSVIVQDFGMLRTGGSDWHGATTGARILGNMNIPGSWLEEQDAHVAV